MQTMDARRTEFVRLLETYDEQGSLEYITKYDDFYDAIMNDQYRTNMLQHACRYRLERVALALIDKNCDLTYQDHFGITALMIAGCYELKNVVAYIIDKSPDTTTRNSNQGMSEMMYICLDKDIKNLIKMIDRGYDIYYKNDINESLFTYAVKHMVGEVVKKLIDIDINFASEFNILYNKTENKDKFYDDIGKYCRDKRDAIKTRIIATMNDASPANALYKSFHKTYAIQLVDVICDFIIL